ncbi:hypothetical protein K432DRAFT_101304 [Lepidopterella palustris CBS 459.81]|uniref:Uncharacterized protein n=1 Tax=Lepidopterella palustris CBS 459.81 TaxID=1314670 RepID=A0A8E2JD02_9PEZI|nr:hypothetical protein K432DRAFT_101304 [Lepidopterella palustris CBS 459.81]
MLWTVQSSRWDFIHLFLFIYHSLNHCPYLAASFINQSGQFISLTANKNIIFLSHWNFPTSSTRHMMTWVANTPIMTPVHFSCT